MLEVHVDTKEQLQVLHQLEHQYQVYMYINHPITLL